jgi:ribosomal protein S18 acetylase RimI-like enzyme
MDLDISPVRQDELPVLHGLIESAYRGDSAKRGWTHEADLLGGQRTDLEALEAMSADPMQALLVARDGISLAGCVSVANRGAGLAYIGLVTVDPERQAGGLGQQLLGAAERHAISTYGAKRAEMTVIVHRSELIAWYERRGYALTGERRPFPATDPRFGLPQRADLEFVVLEKRL